MLEHWKGFCSLVVFLSCFAISMAGQESWSIQGKVVDSLNQPIEQALVYITPDSSDQFLKFAYSNPEGTFDLKVSNSYSKVILHVQFLGYSPYKKLIQRENNEPLRILLKPSSVQIREVVVSDERPAIVEKSDTTVYDLKQFADSTEYNVEDLLKKIPGIEVKPDGSINVNGKAIDKVLIEDADLFGRNYTLATQNIRANFIEQVEVIDHYQDNPVLKDVNLSDKVVLNLLMKEEKKNIVSGMLDGGLGWGEELKGSFNANLFSVSRRTKIILLSDNGNSGNHYGPNELTARYGNFDERDLKNSLIQPPDFTNSLNLQNPGLPSVFVDNSINYFSSLRSIHNLNESWSIQFNGVFAKKEDLQRLADQTNYLFDQQVYDLDLNQRNKLNKQFAEVDLQLNHVNKDQSRSFFTYAKWNNIKDDGLQSLLQIEEDTLVYDNTFNKRQTEWLISSLFSQKLNDKSVAQIQAKMTEFKQPEWLVVDNNDFTDIFNIFPEPTLDQQLRFQHREASFSGKYLRASGPLLIELEPQLTVIQSTLSNTAFFTTDNENSVPAFEDSTLINQIRSHRYRLHFQMKNRFSARSTLNLNLRVQQQDYNNRQEERGLASLLTLYGGVRINHTFRNGGESYVSYAYRQSPPDPFDFFQQSYFSSAFAIQNLSPLDRFSSGQEIALRYSQNETLKFRNYYIRLRYLFNDNRWIRAFSFERSLNISEPFFSKGNGSFSLSGSFDQFIPRVKTNLTFRASLSLSENQFLVQNVLRENAIERISLNAELRTLMIRNLNLSIDNQMTFTNSFLPSDRSGTLNENLAWRTEVDAVYRLKDLNVALSFYRTQFKNNQEITADLLGSRFKIELDFQFNKQASQLELQLNNLFNRGNFGQISGSNFFLFSSMVEAIPRFFILKWDVSL